MFFKSIHVSSDIHKPHVANELAEKHADVVVRLECRSDMRAEGRARGVKDEWELVRIRVEKGASITLNGMPFQLPAVPASYHGGALRDEPWEAVMAQHGMWYHAAIEPEACGGSCGAAEALLRTC